VKKPNQENEVSEFEFKPKIVAFLCHW